MEVSTLKMKKYVRALLIGLGIGLFLSVFLNIAFSQIFGLARIYFPILIVGTVIGGVVATIIYTMTARKKEKI